MEKNEEIRGDITDLEMSPQAAGAESVFRNTFFGKQTSKACVGLFHFQLLSK